MKQEAEKAKQAAEKLSQDSDLKQKMKELFVNELMRRQEVSGTFEITEGELTLNVNFTKNMRWLKQKFIEYDAIVLLLSWSIIATLAHRVCKKYYWYHKKVGLNEKDAHQNC